MRVNVLKAIFFVCMGYLALFYLFPILYIVGFSFFRESFSDQSYVFAGLENYRSFFQRDFFRPALKNTLLMVAIKVPVSTLLALAISLLIVPFSEKIRVFFKLSFYIPVVVSSAVISLAWLMLFHHDGMLNHLMCQYLNPIMEAFKLPVLKPQYWLESPETSFLSILIVSIIRSPGPSIVILSTALASIPKPFYEVAYMDGASIFKRFQMITLPLLKPALLVVMLLNTITAFQTFVEVYLLTNEGPGYSSAFLLTRIYKVAFITGDIGLSSAMTVVLFLLLVFVVLFQYFIFRSDKYTKY